ILKIFKGMKVALKKSSKKVLSKKSEKIKAPLKETRGSELTQSFLKRFDNLRIKASSGSNTYEYSNTSEYI
ncbi:19070_t:CDS:1, partial [Gigaspora margarita]